MTDEIKLNKALSRGARAQQVLDNELVKEAYQHIENDLIAAWIGSDPRDTEGRERCFHMIHANRKHKGFFEGVLQDGKLAEVELKQTLDMAERKKRFGII